jgi:hypothetical protein
VSEKYPVDPSSNYLACFIYIILSAEQDLTPSSLSTGLEPAGNDGLLSVHYASWVLQSIKNINS